VINMGAITRDATARLEELLNRTEAKVELPADWPNAFGYGPWVTHIWSNYISNAAKYAGPNAQITLGGELSADGLTARFWVQDQGAGLTQEEQDQLFTPFTRLQGVRATGAGLGLSIVRRIAERLSGRVGVQSTKGAGARFWFELPTREPAPSRVPKAP
jgi:signal transduction histidine kinase